MRLQLTASHLVVAALLWPTGASADSGVTARVDSYDDGSFTVLAPAIRGVADPVEGIEVEATYIVDMVSGATRVLTADAVTSATRFEEKRHEVRAAVMARGGPLWVVGASFGTSLEPDYTTHLMGFNGSIEILDRMATVTGAYQATWERVASVIDESFDEPAATHTVDLGWVHVLGAATALHGRVSGAFADCGKRLGCHASAYRYVALHGADSVRSAVPERHPDSRLRGSASVRLVQGFGDGWAVHLGWRRYADDWGLSGDTAQAALAVSGWADRVLGRIEARASSQRAVDFHRDGYSGDGIPQHRTADRELSGLQDLMLAARGRLSVSGVGATRRLSIDGRIGRLWYRYDDDAYPDRQGWLIGGGVSAEF